MRRLLFILGLAFSIALTAADVTRMKLVRQSRRSNLELKIDWKNTSSSSSSSTSRSASTSRRFRSWHINRSAPPPLPPPPPPPPPSLAQNNGRFEGFGGDFGEGTQSIWDRIVSGIFGPHSPFSPPQPPQQPSSMPPDYSYDYGSSSSSSDDYGTKTQAEYDAELPSVLPKFTKKGSMVEQSLLEFQQTEYLGVVTIGTPQREYPVIFDTGSTILWIKCDPPGRDEKFDYGCQQSSTCQMRPDNFQVHYAMTNGTGQVVTDVICLGAYCTNSQQPFGCLASGSESTPQGHYHGIFGMSYGPITRSIPSVMPQIFANKGCSEHVAGFWMGDSQSDAGEVTVCGVDKSHFSGNLFYVSLNDDGYWQTKLDGVKLGGRQVVRASDRANAIFDTGTSLITGPPHIVDPILRHYGADDPNAVYLCSDFRKLGNTTLTLGGRDFVLTPQDLAIPVDDEGRACVMGIMSIDLGDNSWLLGNVFMRKFFVAFDWDRSAVGLAPVRR